MDNSTSNLIVASSGTFVISLSDGLTQVLQVINYVVLCGIISVLGIGGNIVNIIVFVKQKFKDSINISLLGLAISDLASSFTMFWISVSFNPLFLNTDLPIEHLDVMYVIAGWPHVFFNRVTSFITSFITLERCLCIAKPLKVKNIITPFRTKVIIGMIYLSMIILFSPVFVVNKLEWVYNVSRNRSIYSLVFTDDKGIVDSVTFFIHSVALSLVFLLSVAISTIILVVKLNEKTKWRQATVAQTASRPETTSVKDKRVVKMITMISSIFIGCYLPSTIYFLVMVFCPDVRYDGKFRNVFHVTWSVLFVLEALNSSVNIFVYFKMSSKFKSTLGEIFCGRPKQ